MGQSPWLSVHSDASRHGKRHHKHLSPGWWVLLDRPGGAGGVANDAPASRRGFGGGVRNDAPPGAGDARGVRNDDLAALRAGVPAAQVPPEGGVPGQRPGRTAGRTQAPQVPECGLFSE